MENRITLALTGNPNAGKTTLFNALTGARQHVGNWPGVTVEKKEGSLRHNGREIHVVDLPGTYSLTAYSLEEIIARNFIVDCLPDVVVNVVDASNLERNLYLSIQLLEMGVKVVVALNMMDVAESRNIKIDTEALSSFCNAPVIPTNGKKGIGIENLLDSAIEEADKPRQEKVRIIQYGGEVEEELDKLKALLNGSDVASTGLSREWLALKLLEGDPDISKKFDGSTERSALFHQIEKSRTHLNDIFDDPPEILLADSRYGFITGALKTAVQKDPGDRIHLSESFDSVLTHRFLGPIVLFATLYAVYVFTFQGSEIFVSLLNAFFKWLGGAVSNLLPDGLLKSLIVSGIIDGVGGVLGFTPLIAFMFLAIAFLEDTGYMARIAFMLDRILRGFGLHGASMLALLVSGGLAGGCAVPGIMATRTMKEPKERLVTILVAPLMNCGAKLPVYALLIGAFFSSGKPLMMFLLTGISWFLALTAAKVIRSTVLSGPSAPFVLELPPYRVPTLKGLLIHTWERTWMYVKKAGTVILAISVVLWAMMTFPQMGPELSAKYDERIAQLSQSFIESPSVNSFLKSQSDLEAFEEYLTIFRKSELTAIRKSNKNFLQAASEINSYVASSGEGSGFARLYVQFEREKNEIQAHLQSEKLKHTIGGRLGLALEKVLWPLGFDWRTNVALVGGFAAKEVVVATLGTAYSLGDVNPEQSRSLGEKLRQEPGWNPLQAFTLILFVMLYNPCLTTLVVIKRESGKWRWMFFAMFYTTAFAYMVALVTRTVGIILGLGV